MAGGEEVLLGTAVEFERAVLPVGRGGKTGEITLRVEAGEWCTLFGPAGAGKSLLLRAAAGLVAPLSGSARVLGGPPRQAVRRVSTAGIPRRSAVLGTVQQAVHRAAGRVSGPRAARVIEALEACGLYELRERSARELSLGEAAALSLACALAARPAVLLVDSLLAILSDPLRDRIRGHLDDVRREEGMALLEATARAEDAQRADRIVVLDSGRVLAWDAPSALLDSVGRDLLFVEPLDPSSVQMTLRGAFDVEVADEPGAVRIRPADREAAAAHLLRHPPEGARLTLIRPATLWSVHEALRLASGEGERRAGS